MAGSLGFKKLIAILLVMAALIWSCQNQTELPKHKLALEQPDVSDRPEAVQVAVNSAFQTLKDFSHDVDGEVLGQAYGHLGMVLLANGLPDLARVGFLEAIRHESRNFQWPYLMGYLASEAEDWPLAVEWYEKSMALEPRYAATHVRLGRIYLQLGQLEKAETEFNWVLKVNPESAAAHFGLGRLAYERKEFSAAVRLYEKALTQMPSATSVYYPLAMAYRQLGDREKAQAVLSQRGKEDTPFFDPIIVELEALDATPEEAARKGLAALEANRFDRAESLLSKAVELDPGNAAMHLNYGFLKLRKSELVKAKLSFQKALALNPQLIEAHTNLGVVFAMEGNDLEAVGAFERALAFDEQFQGARVLLANARMRLGQWEKALDLHRQITEANPTDSRASFYEVLMLVKLGKEDEAWKRLQEALAKFPNQAELVEAQVRLQACTTSAALKDEVRALQLAQALFQGRSSLSHAQTLAMALAANGRFQEAANLEAQGLAQISQGAHPGAIQVFQERLAQYQAGQPCRQPWADGDPHLRPGPP